LKKSFNVLPHFPPKKFNFFMINEDLEERKSALGGFFYWFE